MTSFLKHVAEDIIKKHGTDLSRTAIVFPNKRASLFLNDALARIADRPIWSPAYITISDLFRKHSNRQVADDIKLVCDLHRVYNEVTGYDETLDHFYGWGQLLLTDFDDIDKNMAPAHQVFTNLKNIHELDDISYLTEEQLAMIRKFFSNFNADHNSELKERFLRLWSGMDRIYQLFNERLQSQGLAYEGALYREVAEDNSIEYEYERYIFVGFNLLQQVEQRLFTTLNRQGKARFYWDYDNYYLKSEAGRYINQYLPHFTNELDSGRDEVFNVFREDKNITFVSAPTETIQARYASQWLRQNGRIDDGRRTAIVLGDESLLPTVIHCLPSEVQAVNITTGYPMQQAMVASFIAKLVNLNTLGYDRQRCRFRPRYLKAVKRHPYAKYIDDDVMTGARTDDNSQLLSWLTTVVKTVARRSAENDVSSAENGASEAENGGTAKATDNVSPFTAESLFRAYTMLNRLKNLVDAGDLMVDTITLQRLISQLLQQTSIPFHGEPAVGLQVMGVLETRNLDFEHVLLLSANEGNIPRGVNDASFIPYSIRKAFGLTTVDNKVAIYAYYFNRLLSRATDITLCYNNATSDGHTGEMSRFMLQLLVESPHTIRQLTLQGGQRVESLHPHAIVKNEGVLEALRSRFALDRQKNGAATVRPLLTPTAINRYMRCPLQFYYNYVEGLREPDDNEEETIDNRVFGNIFHEAAQTVYEKMMQKSSRITAADIDSMLKAKVDIERAVDDALRKELFKISERNARMPELNGMQIINREVIIHYLRQLLTLDRRLTPFTIVGLETDVVERMDIRSLGITTTVGGRIDRLDMVTEGDGDRLRVIDYKTGGRKLTPLRSVEDIFSPEQLRNHNDYYLQTLLYARLVSKSANKYSASSCREKTPVAPALLFIQHSGAEDYDPVLRFGNQRIYDMATADGDRFVEILCEKVEEIFNPATPFSPTDDGERCAICPYALFCGLDDITSNTTDSNGGQ